MERISKILKKQITITLIAIFFGFIVAGFILAATGYNPFETFSVLFSGMFSKPKYVMNIVIKATPIILTGISVAFAFKLGLFNIGVEGQFVVGTVAATITGILFDFPPVIQYLLVIISGIVAGGLYGAIGGFLKARYGIHEVITGIMFNWIAFYAGNYVVTLERFHQPNSSSTYAVNSSGLDFIYNWKSSDVGRAIIKGNEFLREIIGKTDANIGIFFAIAVAILISILLKKTTKGMEFRAVGFNKDAAESVGINIKRNIIQALFIGGAIAGLAGALQITGVSQKIFTLGAPENYGFNGMSVALIAGSSPIGSIFAGLLFAGLFYGGGSIQSEIGAPSEIIDIMVGTIVFFIALTKVVPILADKLVKRGDKHVK